jgi:quinol monooxygenase YgiN
MSRGVGHAVYMRVRTKPQKREEFLALIRELRANVLAHEPGTVFFELLQGADANEFVFMEGFVDAAAQKVHADAPYHRAMSAAGWACLDGTPVIEHLSPSL